MSKVTAAGPVPDASSLVPRAVLRATWALFQQSWPTCLPLALLGVTASGVPGSEAAANGAARGLSQDPQWWSLYVVSTVLTLICYGAVVQRQLSLVAGEPLPVFDALRRSALRLPAAASVAVLVMLLVAAGLVLAVVPGLAALVWLSFAWIAALEGALPVAALRESVALVRGRFWAVAKVLAVLAAAVLVFVVLAGIFVGVLMAIAGKQGPTSVAGQAASRLLFGTVIALPVVYVGAAMVVLRRRLGG